jgi:undecaprenyl diphosphate synthase
MAIDSRIATDKLPRHVAIIMDGNGRWAKQQGEERIFGHQNGVKSVRECTEAAAELGIEYLTMYAFSTENWNRPKEEVDALMSLLVKTLHAELPTLNKNSIRLHAIGRLHLLPEDCQQELQQTIELTKGNSRLNLVLALSYSSKSEITDAVKEIAASVKQGKISPEQVNEELIQQHLYTRNIPDPELMIRSSGEHRISNFLLWQLAYAELYFTDKLWPEITRQDFYDAIVDFQKRERRFGMTTEQIQ